MIIWSFVNVISEGILPCNYLRLPLIMNKPLWCAVDLTVTSAADFASKEIANNIWKLGTKWIEMLFQLKWTVLSAVSLLIFRNHTYLMNRLMKDLFIYMHRYIVMTKIKQWLHLCCHVNIVPRMSFFGSKTNEKIKK